MASLVAKFGGTSLGTPKAIARAARHVARERQAGHKIAVIVSAMGKETDRLTNLIHQLGSDEADPRESDAALAAGEQVSAALLALALQQINIPARSFLGWQVPIHTDKAYGRAHIQSIDTSQLKTILAEGIVPVIAGFQGISAEHRIATLGRGGSDSSAVALAAALEARRCDIYTDVAGVYSSDPRHVKNAFPLEKITYEEMLEMASLGAQILHTRAASMAMHYQTRLRIRPSGDAPQQARLGTLVCSEQEIMEQKPATGLTHSSHEAKITLTHVKDRPGIAAAIMSPLAEAGIILDMIVQTAAQDGFTDLTFTLPQTDLPRALKILTPIKEAQGFASIHSDDKVAKLSVVGIGMRTHAGTAATMFQTLADKNINIQAISTSEIKLSVLIDQSQLDEALAVLHKAFLE